MASSRYIDVHHHILPPDYVEALDRIGQSRSGSAELPKWTKESALTMLDQQGIQTAIASISSPGIYFGDMTFTRELARRCNDILAELVRDYPQRFGGFAILPLPDVDAALREIEYALDTLKLDGVILLASVGDQYLGDPAFDAVFAELDRRKAVVLLHPTMPPGSDVPKLMLPGFLVEFMFDTSRAVTNLIYSGTLERYSQFSLILAHAGGAIPYLAGRLAIAPDIMPNLHEKAPQGAIAYLKRLYYDTAISATPYALRSLQALVEPSQILFGSDYPYLSDSLVAKEIQGLETYVDEAQLLAAIQRENALKLFPRLGQAIRTA